MAEEQQAWVTGLYDAHCHPTEHPELLQEIASMKAGKICAMSTNFGDIDLVAKIAEQYPDKVIPAFGYHPWFSHLVFVGDCQPSKNEHYRAVIAPEPPQEFIDTLPDPLPFNDYLAIMRSHLERYPHALVGELGSDRAYRLPNKNPKEGEHNLTVYQAKLEHQQAIFELQVELAVELNRPVSVHSVQTHNVVFSYFNSMNTPPPAICLHSYSGSPEFLKNYLVPSKKQKKVHKFNAFVSCSVLINLRGNARSKAMLDVIPSDKILTESDYSRAGHEMDDYIQQSFCEICKYYDWSEEEGKEKIAQNFKRFLLLN